MNPITFTFFLIIRSNGSVTPILYARIATNTYERVAPINDIDYVLSSKFSWQDRHLDIVLNHVWIATNLQSRVQLLPLLTHLNQTKSYCNPLSVVYYTVQFSTNT